MQSKLIFACTYLWIQNTTKYQSNHEPTSFYWNIQRIKWMKLYIKWALDMKSIIYKGGKGPKAESYKHAEWSGV